MTTTLAVDDDLIRVGDLYHFPSCATLAEGYDSNLADMEPGDVDCSCDSARAGYIRGLVELADLLYNNPKVSLPAWGDVLPVGLWIDTDTAPSDVADIAALTDSPTARFEGNRLHVDARLAGLKVDIITKRELVAILPEAPPEVPFQAIAHLFPHKVGS